MGELIKHMTAISTVLNTVGAVGGGIAANRSARFQAAQLEQQAGQARATGQRAAAEERRQAQLVQSRLQARAGGGGLDESVTKAAGDIAAEGEYRSLVSMFEAEERARGLETQAAARRYDGRQARVAGALRGIGSVVANAETLYDKYGKGGWQASPDVYGHAGDIEDLAAAGRRAYR